MHAILTGNAMKMKNHVLIAMHTKIVKLKMGFAGPVQLELTPIVLKAIQDAVCCLRRYYFLWAFISLSGKAKT